MLTEVKKTVHIIVDDIHVIPDEKMIADAVVHNNGIISLYQEHGDALRAAAKLGLPEKTYRVWTVHMHFVRDCAFEPIVGNKGDSK